MNKGLKICDKVIEFGILAIVFFIPIYFAFFQVNYNVFELNKLVAFRILLTIAILAAVAKVFIKRNFFFRPNQKLFIFLSLLGFSFFISTYLSIHPQLSFWGSYGRQQGFYSFFHYLLFFVLLVVNFRSWVQIKKIIVAAMASSIFVCSYGLLQYFALDPLDWKEKALYTSRIFSSLGQPNFLGQYLILVIPFTVFSLIFISRLFIARFLLFILLVAQLAGLIFSYSRAAWLGLLASFYLLAVLFLFIKKKKKMAWGLVGLGLAGIIALASFNIFFAEKGLPLEPGEINFLNRAESIFDIRAGSNKIRLYYWQAAGKEFKQASGKRKLIGYGPETLADIFIKYYRPEWGVYEKINTFPDRSHNAIFDIILQFGLAGLAAVIIFLGYIFFAVGKYLKKFPPDEEYWLVVILLSSLGGYFVNNLFSFSLTVGYVYFYLILALLVVIIFPESPHPHPDKKEKKFFQPLSLALIWLAMLFFGAVLVYYYNVNAWRADYYYMKAKKAEVEKDCPQILDNMEKTVALNPLSTFYKERYIFHNLNCFEGITSEESRNNSRDNIISMDNSIEPREYGFYSWANIAHVKSLFGYYFDPAYYEGAEEDYKRLLEINPYITTTYQDLGRMKLWQKDYPAAIDNFKKAMAAFPPIDNPYLNKEHKEEIEAELVRLFEMLGLAYSYSQDWEQALDYYQRALKLNPSYLRLYKKVADVYYGQGDLAKAIWYNKRGYMLNKQDYSWPLALALLFKEQGDMAEARNYINKAWELAPDDELVIKFKEEIKE